MLVKLGQLPQIAIQLRRNLAWQILYVTNYYYKTSHWCFQAALCLIFLLGPSSLSSATASEQTFPEISGSIDPEQNDFSSNFNVEPENLAKTSGDFFPEEVPTTDSSENFSDFVTVVAAASDVTVVDDADDVRDVDETSTEVEMLPTPERQVQARNYVAYIPVPINDGDEEEEGDGDGDDDDVDDEDEYEGDGDDEEEEEDEYEEEEKPKKKKKKKKQSK